MQISTFGRNADGELSSTPARRIAHDMSNQLMVIAGNLELLRMKLPEEPKLRSYLELAVAAVDRCEALAEQLGALARGPDSRT